MNKTVVATISSEFEAGIISELLKQNGIENEVLDNNGVYTVSVSDIDLKAAQTIVNNYNNPESKKETEKAESLKSRIVKIILLIGSAALFYYIISLLFELILKLF